MKIIQKIKNKLSALALPIFLAMPTEKKEISPVKEKPEDDDDNIEISQEDQLKFQENAIEYNPETRKLMESYYMDFRNEPKQAYIVGIAGNRIEIKDRKSVGKEAPVKRKV